MLAKGYDDREIRDRKLLNHMHLDNYFAHAPLQAQACSLWLSTFATVHGYPSIAMQGVDLYIVAQHPRICQYYAYRTGSTCT